MPALVASFVVDLPDASPPRESHRAVFRIPRLGEVERDDWHQLLRFCLVGTSGVVVNLAVFSVLVTRWDVHHMVAATISFVVAWSTNFWLNKHWTFRRHGLSIVQQGARNLVVSLVALGLNLVLLYVLEKNGLSEILAQLIAIAVVTPVNFLLNRRWSFK